MKNQEICQKEVQYEAQEVDQEERSKGSIFNISSLDNNYIQLSSQNPDNKMAQNDLKFPHHLSRLM